ncbi:hypothetical protein B0H14DRAFT_3470614 [Mycena olivaceomarginata]|nr:hypothetical protein B0H14DRAFT_3470614 [Mycena olivaceomarginata]
MITDVLSAAFSAALATTWRLPAVRASLQDLPPLYCTRWTGSPESPHSAAAFGPRLACCCAGEPTAVDFDIVKFPRGSAYDWPASPFGDETASPVDPITVVHPFTWISSLGHSSLLRESG